MGILLKEGGTVWWAFGLVNDISFGDFVLGVGVRGLYHKLEYKRFLCWKGEGGDVNVGYITGFNGT